MYDTPPGVPGTIDTKAGTVTSGPLAGNPAGTDAGSKYTPPAGNGSTPSPYFSRVSGGDMQLDNPTPQSEEQIQASKINGAQGEINSLNDYYKSLNDERNVINAKNDRSTAAVSTLNGLAGSTEADQRQQTTTKEGQAATDKIKNEAAMKIQGILSTIRSDSATEARQQRLDYNKNISDSITNDANRAALDATKQKQAVEHITNLTAAGVTADGLKNTDPTSYAHLLASYNGDEAALKGAFVLNTPKDQILTSSIVGGSLVIARQNPLTGAITHETVDLGLPKGSVQVADAGGYLLFGKAGADGKWDGDMSTTTKINKTMTPGQQATASLTGVAGVSQELKDAITSGLIDPNKINSRTLGIYNSLAQSQVDAAGAHASISGNTKAFEDATRYATTATRVVTVLEKNMPLLADLADKVNQTGVPGLDQYINGVKAYTGNNQDVVKYVSTLKTLRSEYAQMLARGAAVTESDKSEAAQAIPAGLSGSNYLSLKSQLQLEGTNIIDTANEVKNSLFTSTQKDSKADASSPATGTDGASYGFPGYHSDGKQWVPN